MYKLHLYIRVIKMSTVTVTGAAFGGGEKGYWPLLGELSPPLDFVEDTLPWAH